MTDHDREPVDAGARVSVTIELTAKGPRWRVRTTDLADEELIDRAVAEAVRGYHRVEAELERQARPPFVGEEPDPE
jgi:glutathione S-transferase